MKSKQDLDLSIQNFLAMFVVVVCFFSFGLTVYGLGVEKTDCEVFECDLVENDEDDYVYEKHVQYLDGKDKSDETVTNDEGFLIFDEAIVENTVDDVDMGVVSGEVNDDVINVEVNDENVESSDDVDVVVDNGVTETKESLGVPTEYTAVYDVKATAYCLCKKCCGKSPDSPNYGMTSSGLRIVPGTGMKVIAVDDDIIPLGSEVYVEGLNGAVDYGYAIAADTGSAIKDYKIDLYMDTHQEAYRWGVKTVRLYVL